MLGILTQRGRATAHFTIDGTVEQVHARVKAIAGRERRFRWREEGNDTVVLDTAANWATWGERMTVTLGIAGQTSTSVTVRVEPEVRTTVIDWGQGAWDIGLLHECLTAAGDSSRGA